MTPEIRKRIELCQSGEIPDGYAIGKEKVLYPEDWKMQRIGQWLKLKERPVHLEDDEEYELVTVRRGYGGVDSRGKFLGKDILVKTYVEIREGDFLISKRQIAHGACGVVPHELDGAVVSNEYNVFEPVKDTSVEMFDLLMHLPRYKQLYYLMSDGVHIEKLLFKTQDWMKRKVAMPDEKEQRKIAAILTTQDKVIELKERLLEEKKQQKKYLMQQLLTGKKRLPGYNEKWKSEKLSSFCQFVGGGTPNTKNSEYWNGTIPWISSSDLIDENFDYINITRFITEEAVKNSSTKICPKGSILVVNRVGVGKLAIAKECVCTSQDFVSLLQERHNNIYLAYALYWFLQKKLGQVQGSAIKGIPTRELKEYELAFPSYREQNAIAEVLSTAHHEIDLLQQSIEAEKQKKKALMQLLLTGIVRVKT